LPCCVFFDFAVGNARNSSNNVIKELSPFSEEGGNYSLMACSAGFSLFPSTAMYITIADRNPAHQIACPVAGVPVKQSGPGENPPLVQLPNNFRDRQEIKPVWDAPGQSTYRGSGPFGKR
jgi:hypothetical protein